MLYGSTAKWLTNDKIFEIDLLYFFKASVRQN